MMSDKKPGSDNAGSIRAAGGAFAKMEIAHEEQYFYDLVRFSSFYKSIAIVNKFDESADFLFLSLDNIVVLASTTIAQVKREASEP